MIGYWSLQPHAKKGFKPKDLGAFDWEKSNVDELLEIQKKMKEMYPKGKLKFVNG